MTDEELVAAKIPHEDYESGKATVIAAIDEYGSVISYFEFNLQNENGQDIHNGPFEVKIKFTDNMKGYDFYKLIFVEIDDTTDETTIEDAIELTVVDGYLVGTVPHFSGYALVGTMDAGAPYTGTSTTENNAVKLTFSTTTFIATILVLFFAFAKFSKRQA